MSLKITKIASVPTNIITGFLGVGKTTAITHLLKTKPKEQSWAILVNEFGEIGIDASWLNGQLKEQQGVFIREVPGGCMCCASGLPMQVVLGQLLREARPDRLIVEPTGLGHPIEVVDALTQGSNKSVLELQSIITLVDARHFSDSRYTSHPTFNQQVEIADTIVVNKQDLATHQNIHDVKQFIDEKCRQDIPVLFAEQGKICPSLLWSSSAAVGKASNELIRGKQADVDFNEAPIPTTGFLEAINRGEGYASIGWRFAQGSVFDRVKLFAFLSGLSAERMKAVFVTNEGNYGYNLSAGALKELPMIRCDESRIEIISDSLQDQWKSELLACITDDEN